MVYLYITIIILVLSNLWLLRKYDLYKQRYKQKGVFRKWQIQQVSLDQFDPIFATNEFGPTLATQVYFIGHGNLAVPGGTSDAEAWILSVLSKKAMTLFEFGTCTGKTTYLFAKNSNDDAKVITITLSPDQLTQYTKSVGDNEKSTQDAVIESAYTKFLYTATPVETKIVQLYGDSKQFDETPYASKMDLIFIDGSHAYSYVMSDSEKAFKMIAPNGIILWHDYRGNQDTVDVYKALNQIAKNKKLVHIKGTSLVAYRA